MTAVVDPSAAVRAWAIAHARSVGRSGHDPAGAGTFATAAASSGLDWDEWDWPEEVSFRLDQTLEGHSDLVWWVAWSSDPQDPLLATTSADRTARIWNPRTGQCLQTLTGHADEVWSVAWSSDLQDPLLATTSADRTARIWNPRTGQCLHTLTGEADNVYLVAWSPGPHHALLAITSSDETTRIWNADTSEYLRTLTGHTGEVFSVAWSFDPHHPLLATTSIDRTTRIWNPETGECLHTLTGDIDAVWSVAWSRDPRRAFLATTGYDGTARIWDPRTGECLHILTEHTDSVRAVAWSPGPHHPLVATASDDGTARIWNPRTGQGLATIAHPAAVHSVAFATLADGRVALATGCADNKARIWTTAIPFPRTTTTPAIAVTDRTPPQLTERPDEVSSVAWSLDPHHPLLATASPLGVSIWDPSTGDCLHTLSEFNRSGVEIAWSPDTQFPLLATAGEDNTARLWDQHTAAYVRTATGHSDVVSSVAWSPRILGSLLATSSYDGTVRIWNPYTGECLHTLIGHTGAVWSVAWSPNTHNPLLATAGADNTARIWNPDTGECLHTLTGHALWDRAVAWSSEPDPQLATSSYDGTARIWNPYTGECLRTLVGHTGAVYSVAWSPDPHHRPLLATASADRTIRIWDPRTGQCLHTLTGQTRAATTVSWSRSKGQLLLATNLDYRIRIFEVRYQPQHRQTADVALMPVSHLAAALLNLGSHSCWIALGVLTDLVALTGNGGGRESTLYDPRLGPLADHPGVRRLRTLGWRPEARVAFAAFLASGGANADSAYAAPEGASVSELRDALTVALATEEAAALAAATPTAGELAAAADTVSDKTLTLLRILGPDACAGDPLLPLRLHRYVPALPELSPRQAVGLVPSGNVRSSGDALATAQISAHSPGLTGITRDGSLSTALPTQLALPEPLLTLRYARGELLHRARPAAAPPQLTPVTILLDVSPTTYGPCETVLRLLAHLLTTTLWEAGHRCGLITFDHPRHLRELTRTADLLTLWTARTLAPPSPALTAGLHAATTASTRPVLVLTTTHTARDHIASGHLVPGARLQVASTHTSGGAAPIRATVPHHHTLDVDPTTSQFNALIHTLLTTAARTSSGMQVAR